MNVVFRVDASRQIGTGHVMRCLALAEGLQERGVNVSFICAELEGNLIGYLREASYTVHSLPRPAPVSGAASSGKASPYEDWLGAPWQTDAEQTRAILANEERRADYMVVDHYALGSGWEETVAPLVHGILAIDDLANRKHACDILLDQNLPGDGDIRYRDLVSDDTVTLLGPRYALLRPEFAEARRASSIRENGVQRLLIMFGGFDESGETLKALRGLSDASTGIKCDIIISAHNRHKKAIERAASEPGNISLHIQPFDVAGIMSRADFSLGAGGVTLWERCAVRLPSASTIVAENQRAQVQAAAENGLTLLAGEANHTDETGYRELVNVVRRNPELLTRMSAACGNAVDGRGIGRVVARLMAEPVTVRPATADDCMRILEWRNNPLIRCHSADSQPIPDERHRKWFMQAIDDPTRMLLIGETDGEAIGVVRYDLEDKRATVSIYLSPDLVGSGMGGDLLAAAEAHLCRQVPEVREIHAHVLRANKGSTRMFEQAGYERAAIDMIKRL